MQDRYAGDVGDFGKFALLRALQGEGFSVGINWYRAKPPQSERDRLTGGFLRQDGRYRIRPRDHLLDPALARALDQVAGSGWRRSVRGLERAALLDGAKTVYYNRFVPVKGRPAWHSRALQALAGCRLVFLDPDNGLEPRRGAGARMVKYVRLEELGAYLSRGQSVVLYQHRPRKKEAPWFGELAVRLGTLEPARGRAVRVLTCRRGTLRDYLLIAADEKAGARMGLALDRLLQSPWGASGFCREGEFPPLRP